MTDPIGTAQERELIERLREQAGLEAKFSSAIFDCRNDSRWQAADALQSRIAEVGRLSDVLREIADLSLEEDLPLTDAGRCAVDLARAALFLQRRV